jgi:hypothetical protein
MSSYPQALCKTEVRSDSVKSTRDGERVLVFQQQTSVANCLTNSGAVERDHWQTVMHGFYYRDTESLVVAQATKDVCAQVVSNQLLLRYRPMKRYVVTHSGMGDNGFHNLAVTRWAICANKMKMSIIMHLSKSSNGRN